MLGARWWGWKWCLWYWWCWLNTGKFRYLEQDEERMMMVLVWLWFWLLANDASFSVNRVEGPILELSKVISFFLFKLDIFAICIKTMSSKSRSAANKGVLTYALPVMVTHPLCHGGCNLMSNVSLKQKQVSHSMMWHDYFHLFNFLQEFQNQSNIIPVHQLQSNYKIFTLKVFF